MTNYLQNSAAFIRIVRSTALFALMGFFLAACNQETATTDKEEGSAAPSAYTAQSIEQARRDAQTEKNEDRKLSMDLAQLKLEETRISAEQSAKNQFESQAANIESQRIQTNGNITIAEMQTSSQSKQALFSTLGQVVSSVGPAYVQANAAKAQTKMEIDDRKEGREERLVDAEAGRALDYYKIDMEYGGGNGDGKTSMQRRQEALSLSMNDLDRMKQLKAAKAAIDTQRIGYKKAKTEVGADKAQQGLAAMSAQYPELKPYVDSILSDDEAGATQFSSAFDSEIQPQIVAQGKEVAALSKQLPPNLRPTLTPQNDGSTKSKAMMSKIYQKSGVKIPEVVANPVQPPTAKKEGIAQVMCADDDCSPRDKEKLDEFNKDLLELSKKEGQAFETASANLRQNMNEYFYMLSTSNNKAIQAMAKNTESVFNNILRSFSDPKNKEKFKNGGGGDLASMYAYAKENKLMEVAANDDPTDLIRGVENMGSAPMLASSVYGSGSTFNPAAPKFNPSVSYEVNKCLYSNDPSCRS